MLMYKMQLNHKHEIHESKISCGFQDLFFVDTIFKPHPTGP